MSVVFVAAAAGLGLYMSRGPWVAYKEQKLKADLANKEMQKTERDRIDLIKQISQIDSPAGRDRAARKQSYLGKDEVAMTPPH